MAFITPWVTISTIKIPKKRFFSLNSEGEMSVRVFDKPKEFKWFDIEEDELTDTERMMVKRHDEFYRRISSDGFRIYAGVGEWWKDPPTDKPWMTLEYEFIWSKKIGEIAWPAIQAFAKKFNGRLEEMATNEAPGWDFHYSVESPITDYTLADALSLKDEMRKELKTNPDLIKVETSVEY